MSPSRTYLQHPLKPLTEAQLSAVIDLLLIVALQKWETLHAIFGDASFLPLPSDRPIIEKLAREHGVIGFIGWKADSEGNGYRTAKCLRNDPASRRAFAEALHCLSPDAVHGTVEQARGIHEIN